MKKTIIGISVIMLISCSSESIDLDYIKSSEWQYDKGFKIGEGDFVSFEKGGKVFDLKDKTIYFKYQPRAIIKTVNKKNKEMIIESLDKKEKGIYINVEEFTK